MITFTDSPEVGKDIIAKVGLKKVSLELGSNAGVIIEDASNLQEVAQKCVIGAYSNQGKVCISLQRIYVRGHLYDEFLEHFRSEAAKLVCGDPLKGKY